MGRRGLHSRFGVWLKAKSLSCFEVTKPRRFPSPQARAKLVRERREGVRLIGATRADQTGKIQCIQAILR